ncbi:MAG: CHC2 zinc finger domain-containing protein [Actinomycetota bacterium]|nr:CHC2 zinc finger domain-containing protein [Actinomycetota bacterium]
MRISQRSIEEVHEAANIVEVASEFTALRRQGTRFVGLCPYPDHQEKSPSFSVAPDRGFYYCFGCLEANERIWTSRGLIPIAAAEIGDEVIGLNGRRELITDKWFKSGSTLKVKTGAVKEGIELTPDHWCVLLQKEEALRAISGIHLRGSGEDQSRFSGKLRKKDLDARLTIQHASDIRVGDFWLYPVVPDDSREDASLQGEHVVKPYTKGSRTGRIRSLHINCDTAWLYGVWLAEGSLYRGGVRWSFGGHEAEDLAKRVMLVLEKEFGRPSAKYVRPDRNICEVTCSSTDLSTLFGYWFGYGCANKRVPVEALNWTAECQAALIEGYVDGDGHTGNGMTSACTVSEELAYGAFAMCIQAGKACSISTTAARTGKDGVRHKKTYYIHILGNESLQGFFAEINGTRYFLSAVRKVETAQEEPTVVVDITTTGSHTFLTKMGITHNCQRGGDAIKLVSELKSFSFADAVSYLAERSGVELQFEGGPDSEAARERTRHRRAIHKALAVAAVYYHKYLLKSRSARAEHARNYLQDRGIKFSTIEEFRIGYAPSRGNSGLIVAAAKLGLDRRVLDEAGLLTAWGGERFSGRITFPISDRRGRIVGFGARTLGDDQPKYLNSPEMQIFNKRNLLYGFPQVSEAIRKERAALIVEGYTDVLMLYQAGIRNVVATLGTATTAAHLRTLSGYADRIYLLFDPDEAGERATQKVRAAAREAVEPKKQTGIRGIRQATVAAARMKLDLRVLRLSEDPADWLREHRPEEFTELLWGAVPILEYVFRHRIQRALSADTAGRSRAMPEIKDLLREIRIEDPIFYQDAIRLAAEALGIDPELLEERREPAPSAGSPRKRGPADPHTEAEREVLALILAHPALAAKPLERGVQAPSLPEPFMLRAEDFGDETHARIFALLQEHPGEYLGTVLSDERARNLMDRLVALGAKAEEMSQKDLYSSEASVRMTWLRLGILSRESSKRQTQDLDEKVALQTEIQALQEALRAVSVEP